MKIVKEDTYRVLAYGDFVLNILYAKNSPDGCELINVFSNDNNVLDKLLTYSNSADCGVLIETVRRESETILFVYTPLMPTISDEILNSKRCSSFLKKKANSVAAGKLTEDKYREIVKEYSLYLDHLSMYNLINEFNQELKTYVGEHRTQLSSVKGLLHSEARFDYRSYFDWNKNFEIDA